MMKISLNIIIVSLGVVIVHALVECIAYLCSSSVQYSLEKMNIQFELLTLYGHEKFGTTWNVNNSLESALDRSYFVT